jgi:hypothetical protein
VYSVFLGHVKKSAKHNSCFLQKLNTIHDKDPEGITSANNYTQAVSRGVSCANAYLTLASEETWIHKCKHNPNCIADGIQKNNVLNQLIHGHIQKSTKSIRRQQKHTAARRRRRRSDSAASR